MDVPLTTPLGHLCLKARSIQRMSTKLGFKVMRFKFTNYSDESEKNKAYWIYSLTITRPVSGLPKLARYWQIFQKWPSFFFLFYPNHSLSLLHSTFIPSWSSVPTGIQFNNCIIIYKNKSHLQNLFKQYLILLHSTLFAQRRKQNNRPATVTPVTRPRAGAV